MTKCQRSIDKMGRVVHSVFTAVCSVIYGGIQNSRRDKMSDVGTCMTTDEAGKLNVNTQEETPKPEPEPKPKDAEKKEAEEKEEEKEDARDITNQQANTARKAAYQAAINAGATPAQAQSAADAQTPIGNYAGNYAALSSAGANARAAYRERQGYADALSRETENLENARTKAIIAAALSGGGSGAQTGLSLFGN